MSDVANYYLQPEVRSLRAPFGVYRGSGTPWVHPTIHAGPGVDDPRGPEVGDFASLLTENARFYSPFTCHIESLSARGILASPEDIRRRMSPPAFPWRLWRIFAVICLSYYLGWDSIARGVVLVFLYRYVTDPYIRYAFALSRPQVATFFYTLIYLDDRSLDSLQDIRKPSAQGADSRYGAGWTMVTIVTGFLDQFGRHMDVSLCPPDTISERVPLGYLVGYEGVPRTAFHSDSPLEAVMSSFDRRLERMSSVNANLHLFPVSRLFLTQLVRHMAMEDLTIRSRVFRNSP